MNPLGPAGLMIGLGRPARRCGGRDLHDAPAASPMPQRLSDRAWRLGRSLAKDAGQGIGTLGHEAGRIAHRALDYAESAVKDTKPSLRRAEKAASRTADRAYKAAVAAAEEAKDRAVALAEEAREIGSDLYDTARKRGSSTYDDARDRGWSLFGRARDRGEEVYATARKHGAAAYDDARDRGRGLFGWLRDRGEELYKRRPAAVAARPTTTPASAAPPPTTTRATAAGRCSAAPGKGARKPTSAPASAPPPPSRTPRIAAGPCSARRGTRWTAADARLRRRAAACWTGSTPPCAARPGRAGALGPRLRLKRREEGRGGRVPRFCMSVSTPSSAALRR